MLLQVEIWPPAAPLMPVAPPGSQAASLPSDAPRNTYLHDNLRPVAHVDPDASPAIDTASGASDDDQLQFAATSGPSHQENNHAAAASGSGPQLGTGAVFHDSHASAAHGVNETGHGTAAGMLAPSHHTSDQPASELHSSGSQADSIDASTWGRAASRYNKPNERSNVDDARHATEQPEHDSMAAGGEQESAGNGQTAQLRQLADSAPVKTLDIGRLNVSFCKAPLAADSRQSMYQVCLCLLTCSASQAVSTHVAFACFPAGWFSHSFRSSRHAVLIMLTGHAGVPFRLPAQDPAAAAEGIEELLLPEVVLQQVQCELMRVVGIVLAIHSSAAAELVDLTLHSIWYWHVVIVCTHPLSMAG